MKRKFTAVLSAVLALFCITVAFSACSKTKEKLTDVEEQVAAIEQTVENLKTVDAELKAYIEVLETNADSLKDRVDGIDVTIKELKEKDAALEERIAALEKTAETFATTEWSEAKFATLEQYEAVQTTIDEIRTSILNVNQAVTDLDAKVAANLAAAIEKSETSIGNTIDLLTERVSKNESNIEGILERIEALEEENAALKIRINCLEDKHVWNTEKTVYTWSEKLDKCTAHVECIHCKNSFDKVAESVECKDSVLTATFPEKTGVAQGTFDVTNATEMSDERLTAAVEHMVGDGTSDSVDVKLKLSSSADSNVLAAINSSLAKANDGSVNLVLSGITSVPADAFKNNTKIKSITFGDSTATVGSNAFSGCTALTSVTFEAPLTECAANAFDGIATENVALTLIAGQTVLTSENGSSWVTSKEYMFSATSFCGKTFKSITVDGAIDASNLQGGSTADKKKLQQAVANAVGAGNTKLAIKYSNNQNVSILQGRVKESLKGAADGSIELIVTGEKLPSFSGATQIKSVILGSGMTTIDTSALANCTFLESVVIPDTVTKIGDNAFNGCTSLKSVTLPNGIAEIDNHTFNDCTSLESVEVPDNVKNIKGWAFSGCTGLKEIRFGGTMEQWNAIGKGSAWKSYVPDSAKVICTNGETSL